MPPLQLIAGEEALPGYTLIQRLGRGGFGEVWECEAPGGFRKAIKFVFGDLEDTEEDSPAGQEHKALKRVKMIRHPYILSLEQYKIIDGQLRIVMELADKNLWDRYRECRSQGLQGIPRDELLRYMEETSEALDLMNNHYHIQHLDIKPQNLFLVFNHVKVGDFGLAKVLEGQRATVTGGVTPVYAAPETFEGNVTRYSDQYSLAIVFQELLTGVRPFNGANMRMLLMQHLHGTPDLKSLTPADQAIIGRGLAKKPEERWPTCSDMVRAIKLSGLPSPPSTPISSPTPMTPARGESYSAADSNQMTRVQFGGSGRLGSDPTKTQTPLPPHPNVRPSPPLPPMPALVTTGAAGKIVPKLVTPSPSSEANGPAITLNRPLIFQTARMNSSGIAPPELLGDGVLFPALVVGVGYLGRLVLESLRTIICDHFGNPDQVPNVRFLYIDTDPEAGELATGLPATPAALGAKELVLTRLNRPTHYLQTQSLPPVDQWLPPGSLYKISRTPGAADGVRAFGRLALFDNYRLTAQRIRQQLEMFLTGEALDQADQATMMGLRSNRPRAYVIAGLGGGTGGGMFLDLAYMIRQEIRALGYPQSEVVGTFLIPPADRSAARKGLGNTCAALTELHHFQSKRTKYQTAFDKAEPPLIDGDAPFARVSILELPKAHDPKGRQMTAARAARALFNEILTPAGRVVDEVRDVYRNAFPCPAPTCQAFGLYRLTWPRPEVLGAATRRFAQRIMQRWMVKDSASLREPVAEWLEAQWIERKLNFEQVVEGFEAAARTQLREEPERVFDAFVDPLRTRTPSGAKLDAATVCSVLDQLLKLVGKPDLTAQDVGGSLNTALETRYQELCREGEAQLALMAVTFIEQPQYRLAGSEEAVRQIGERLKRQVDALESLHTDATREMKQTFSRLFQIIGTIQPNGAGWKVAAEVIDLLRAYPRKRLRLQILDKSLSAYRKLLGSTPDYLRDIGICRAGLTDMHAAIGAGSQANNNAAGPGRLILPEGCANLDDAADRFLAGINPTDVLAFDQAVQKAIAKKFRGLAAVCLKPLEKGPHFRELLLKKSREFLDGKLDSADPAAVFFRNRTGGPDDFPLVGEAFDGAAPEIRGYAGRPPDEISILAAPDGEIGDRFRSLVAEALPGVELTPAPLPDDIVFYREFPRLELTDLPQLGESGRAAVEALAADDHPPYSRIDIAFAPPELPVAEAPA